MKIKNVVLYLFLVISFFTYSQCNSPYYATTFEDPLKMCQTWAIIGNSYITYDDPDYYIRIEGDLVLSNFTFGVRGVNVEVVGDVIGEPGSELWAGTDGFLCVNGSISDVVNINLEGGSIFSNCINYDVDPTLNLDGPVEETYTIYPNPTKGKFFIKPNDTYTVKVFDIQGRYLTNSPDLSQFPAGIYLIKVKIGMKELNKKVIKF